ncbi:unnamed protein product, partial [marine sediment metagenome]
MTLTPEEREKIYEEEKVRIEAQEKAKDDIEKKKRKKYGIGCIVVVAIILIIVIAGIIGTSNDENEQSSQSMVPIEITALALYSEYDANEVAAEAKYEDRILRVTGVIRSIGIEILGRPYIVLTSEDEYEVWGVQCIFDEEHKPEIARLAEGQT